MTLRTSRHTLVPDDAGARACDTPARGHGVANAFALPAAHLPAGVPVALVLAAMLLLPGLSGAQLVVPRTIPLHQEDQFAIFPSRREGMGSVSIALDDTLLDPFTNPATAVRVAGGWFQLAPYVHGFSGDRGTGRTIPVSAATSSGKWAAAGIIALQQLEQPARWFNEPISQRSQSNEYIMASVARRLTGTVAVGASVYWSGLGGVDGLGDLYGQSDTIRQNGHQVDVRLGLVRDGGQGRHFELVFVGNRYDMTHDVHYPDLYVWNGPCCAPGQQPAVVPARTEHNVDRSNTWGVHAKFARPVGANGWRVGWMATANRITHPEIPNYEIQNIPRDPGHTDGFDAGVGISRSARGTTFGLDVVLEPMWSWTWATAAHDTLTAVDGIIRAGQRTVDNRFRFSNALLRVGAEQVIPLVADSSSSLAFQAGLGLYSIRYRLEQQDHVAMTARTQDENWMEWTPTLGVRYAGRDFAVAWSYSRTCGPDCSGQTTQFLVPPAPAAGGGGGVIDAPSAPLTYDGGTVSRHRITLSFRIR